MADISNISIIPLASIADVEPGDNLSTHIMNALPDRPTDTDILVVAQKIVSKAENRYVRIDDVTPSKAAQQLAGLTGKDARLVDLILGESSDIIRTAPNLIIVRHRLGFTMANAGIDHSNLGGERDGEVLLLPKDPDASARNIRLRIREEYGVSPGVIISDSFGRPWRLGTTNVAIGIAGVPAIVDQIGSTDRYGRKLEATIVGFADSVASAAGLAMGEAAEGCPAALVRGLSWTADENAGSAALLRPKEKDLFL